MQPAEPRYVERLTVPWWLWGIVMCLVGSLGLIFLPVTHPVVVIGLILVVGALVATWLIVSTPTIALYDDRLVAGRANIPLHDIGPAIALDAELSRLVRGPDIDPSAYHLIRGWVATSVMVEVTDPADPTPYWLLSSRRPVALAHAIDAARAHRPRT